MLSLVFLTVAALPLPPDIDSRLFPNAEERRAAEVEVAGMMSLYPGRVLHGPPQSINQAGRQPRIVQMPRDVYYMRIYDLATALPEIAVYLNKPGLILDLRYVTADAKTSRDFAALLSRAGLASAPVQALGTLDEPEALPKLDEADKDRVTPVVLAMVNGQTSGPLEAWLEAFQEKESVLAVGTPTAGQPGKYGPYPDQPGYYIIEGELRPEGGSIVGTGLKPRFLVEVTPQQNDVAYYNVEQGRMDIMSMLRQVHTVAAPPAPSAATGKTTNNSNSAQNSPVVQLSTTVTTEARDPVLQRAVDVVAALQVLGRLPSSKDTGAAKAPAPAVPAQK